MKKDFLKKLYFVWTFFIILIILAIFFWKEYFIFQKNVALEKSQILETKEKINNFSLKNIDFIEKTDFSYTPSDIFFDEFLEKINSAKKEIFMEVYIFTEKRIFKSLLEAKKRWVNVKILLEKSPYLTENINNKRFLELQKNGIDVKWSNPQNYNLNHSKFYIIDDLSIISTWNLTYSTFAVNRDFFIKSYDKKLKNTLKNIFLLDFSWKKWDFYHENLVVSPNFSRTKIENLLKNAKKSIKIYIQYLNDESINNLLLKLKKEKNLDIKIIIDKKRLQEKNTLFLKNNWIEIAWFNGKTMHAKAILIDEDFIFIWSENFSKYSLDKNREMWIILKEKNIINKFLKLFENDFLQKAKF